MFYTLLATVLAVLSFCYASPTPNRTFTWSFSDPFLSTLTACTSLPIRVENLTEAHSSPPFYMMAFEIDGQPRTNLIGKDFSNLTWLVDYPIGTTLLLNVVDSLGNMGHIPPTFYTVVGNASQCAKTTSSSSFTLVPNVTNSLTTCQPWGLHISGGRPPYSVTLATLNSSSITNMTLGDSDDVFIYINRVRPEGHLMAAVSDSTGQWANGTALVKTTGPTNTSCSDLVSSSGISSQAYESSLASASVSHSPTATPSVSQNQKMANIVVLGVGVGVGSLLLLTSVVYSIFAYRLRRSHALEQTTKAAKLPEKVIRVRPLTTVSVQTVSSVPTISTNTSRRLRRHREPVLSIISWVAGTISPLSPKGNRSSPFTEEKDCTQQNTSDTNNTSRSCVCYAPGGFHLPVQHTMEQSAPLSSVSSSSPIATQDE